MNRQYIELKLRILEETLKAYKNIMVLTKDVFGVDVSQADKLDEIAKHCILDIRNEIGRDKDETED